ncbi:MAG: formate/nitrite transporter family protein [Coriobacteriales bacterium]|jgi:formate/nitrite transporter|nr:formate/nitrite transporter family protein [Coriobacteriales bacterium]
MSTNNFNNQTEITELYIATSVRKATMRFTQTFLLAILAGAFIALGAAASSVAIHTMDNVGLARLIAGCVFPTGLILIMVVGGELFTGNCLMVEALWARQISARAWLRNLIIVFFGNFVGSVLVVVLVVLSTQFNYSADTLGAFTIKVALSKSQLPLEAAFASGILCNILVCLAVLGAFAARDIVGKVVAIFFPIMAFVLSGFEHCIANMYYLVAGLAAAANPHYAARAQELYAIQTADLSWLGIVHNLVPVTLGNLVGGVALGLAFYALYRLRP